MKALLIIGDGMADSPLKELDGRTPLEVAEKPSMDQIAKNGICGILDPISPGIPPGSDTATLALLGYDALKDLSWEGSPQSIRLRRRDTLRRCGFQMQLCNCRSKPHSHK